MGEAEEKAILEAEEKARTEAEEKNWVFPPVSKEQDDETTIVAIDTPETETKSEPGPEVKSEPETETLQEQKPETVQEVKPETGDKTDIKNEILAATEEKSESVSTSADPFEVNYLLIGGGTASFAASRAIRVNDLKAKILIVSQE